MSIVLLDGLRGYAHLEGRPETELLVQCLADISAHSTRSCYKVNAAHAVLIVAQQFIVACEAIPRFIRYPSYMATCTLILKVVALYSFDKRVVVTLATAAIVIVAVAGEYSRGIPVLLS
ncbi:hypothetical protein B0H19DRAFT_1081382 [Mycena capillaripes]|nr:hypothetical protein B0H19DRAFT_1241647 [Mycena capillaripes]KAJ6533221.1 hypothetical protein B0H19DRAFT_1081382 [Mycena capillaripes]